MRQTLAVLCVGLGLAMVGVALGLLYMDYRNERALEISMMAGVPEVTAQDEGRHPGPALLGVDAKKAAIQKWQDPTPIWIALVFGSLGAGLVGSGVLLAMLELPVFQGERRPLA